MKPRAFALIVTLALGLLAAPVPAEAPAPPAAPAPTTLGREFFDRFPAGSRVTKSGIIGPDGTLIFPNFTALPFPEGPIEAFQTPRAPAPAPPPPPIIEVPLAPP